MATVTLYVGSNNETGELELERIEKICAAHHEGFTIARATGYWQGTREDSAVITIADSFESIMSTVVDLKSELAQQAIAYQLAAPLQFA